MSSPLAVETTEAHGCRVECRRFEGPVARELYLLAHPPAGAEDARSQAEAIYRAIGAVLEDEGGTVGSAVTESVFLASLRDLASVRAGREAALGGFPHVASCEIEQPPLADGARLEVALQVAIPHASPSRVETLGSAGSTARCERSPGETRLHAAGLVGAGGDAHAQALAMFGRAEELLEEAGLTFHEVARTWIHLREMDRDYDALNRARRTFFEKRGIDPPPASTGIGGAPPGAPNDLCLALYAVRSENGEPRTVMTSPTLNEAPAYGSDFVRGMKLLEANKVALHVSGTASIDEAGETVHRGDLEAQADRMLVNVRTLLERQGAGFGDVVSAVTYLKDRADTERLRGRLRAAGFEGFPNALVEARVCRPDLLCETELLAVLPRE